MGRADNDAVRFEYHPGWKGLAGGGQLDSMRQWAMDVAKAVDEDAEASVSDWMQFFWWAAGAGGVAPVSGPESPQ